MIPLLSDLLELNTVINANLILMTLYLADDWAHSSVKENREGAEATMSESLASSLTTMEAWRSTSILGNREGRP